jgi:predicted Zn-dependent peptidase
MRKPVVLSNGIRVHLLPYTGTQAVTVLVLVGVGSRFESPSLNGASHFIEHMMFKGTTRRPTTLDISRDLDAVGAEYNAFTGKDYTGYYITIESGKLSLAVDMLHDMIFHSKYDEREMDRERKVIIEEIKMYNENPMMHVEDMLEGVMFCGSSLGKNIAGTAQTMTKMERDEVIAYRDANYCPSKIVIGVAGKLNGKTLRLIKNTFGRIKTKNIEPSAFDMFCARALSAKPRCVVENKKLDQIQLALGFLSFGAKDERLPAASLLATILGGTMSSRLFIQVRERRGLCYFVRAEVGAYEEIGNFMIRSGLDRARLKEAVRTIIGEIEKIKSRGVTDRELKEAKDNFRGRLTLRLEDSSSLADWYAHQELTLGLARTPKERMAQFDAVTTTEIKKVANEILEMKKMSVAAIGPFKDEESFLRAAGF